MALAFFEGYIRNRGPLCRELGLPEGAPERTVLEAGYRRWGKDLPDRLYGAFAFVFHNPEDNSFFCVRDQIGLQPFFYCVNGNREFLYGSDLNELIRDSRYHRAVNREALQHYMNFGYPVGEITLWQGILKLMPGRTLFFRDGEIRVDTYYHPAYVPAPSRTEAA